MVSAALPAHQQVMHTRKQPREAQYQLLDLLHRLNNLKLQLLKVLLTSKRMRNKPLTQPNPQKNTLLSPRPFPMPTLMS